MQAQKKMVEAYVKALGSAVKNYFCVSGQLRRHSPYWVGSGTLKDQLK